MRGFGQRLERVLKAILSEGDQTILKRLILASRGFHRGLLRQNDKVAIGNRRKTQANTDEEAGHHTDEAREKGHIRVRQFRRRADEPSILPCPFLV